MKKRPRFYLEAFYKPRTTSTINVVRRSHVVALVKCQIKRRANYSPTSSALRPRIVFVLPSRGVFSFYELS